MLKCTMKIPCGWFCPDGQFDKLTEHLRLHQQFLPTCEEGTSKVEPRHGKTVRKLANRKPKGE